MYKFGLLEWYFTHVLVRAIDFGTYIQAWIQNSKIISTGEYQKYLAFPQKNMPIYFNVTGAQSLAVLGGLTLAGISKSQVSSQRFWWTNILSTKLFRISSVYWYQVTRKSHRGTIRTDLINVNMVLAQLSLLNKCLFGVSFLLWCYGVMGYVVSISSLYFLTASGPPVRFLHKLLMLFFTLVPEKLMIYF